MYEYKANVVRAVDGDTVDLLVDLGFGTFIKERFRLYGIDAPETRTRDQDEKIRGIEAKRWLISRLQGVFDLRIRTYKDKKGKKEMVELGLAKEYVL